MAEFPTYNQQRNISQTGTPQQAPMQTQGMKAAAELQQNVKGILQEISQANDVMQAATAKNSYNVAIARIDAEEAADSGIVEDENGALVFKDNSEKYIAMRQQAKEAALKNIDNQMVADSVGMELDLDVQVGSIKTAAGFKSKQLEFNKQQVPVTLEFYQKKIVDPNSTPAEVAKNVKEQQEFLDLQVRSGVLTPKEADKALRDAEINAVRFSILTDPSTQENESELLKELQDPNGKFSYLDSEDRLKLIKESQDRIFQNNQAYKRAEKINVSDVMDELYGKDLTGDLTLADIDQASEVAGINKNALKSLKNGLKLRIKDEVKKVAAKEENVKKFIKDINEFVEDPEDQIKAHELIASSYETGWMESKEAKMLEGHVRGIKFSEDRKKFMQNNFIPFKNAVNAVRDFFSGQPMSTPEDHALALSVMLSTMQEGADPVEARRKAIQDYIFRKNPIIRNFSEKGQMAIDANGNVRKVYPNGDYE